MNDRRFEQNPNHLPPKQEEPALHRAARVGNHKALERLVKEGHDVNAPFDMRLDPGARPCMATPFMVAAGSPDGASIDTLRLLLKLGADPLLNLGARSAARFASAGLGWNYLPGGDVGRLRLCLDLGCDVNEIDGRGVTLLADAAAKGDLERVRLLIERGADPNATGPVAPPLFPVPPDWPFDEAAPKSFQMALHMAVEANDPAMVKVLISAGADVSAADQGRRTALFSARVPALTRLLLDAGLDLETQDCLGWTPLVAAVNDGSLEGVKTFLATGADPNASHDRGFTVLMSAVSSMERSLEIMNALLEAGADPHRVTELGWNAFHAAVDVNGAEANAEESVRSTFELLSGLGVDINHRDRQGLTPLARARQCGTEIEVKVLAELGAQG